MSKRRDFVPYYPTYMTPWQIRDLKRAASMENADPVDLLLVQFARIKHQPTAFGHRKQMLFAFTRSVIRMIKRTRRIDYYPTFPLLLNRLARGDFHRLMIWKKHEREKWFAQPSYHYRSDLPGLPSNAVRSFKVTRRRGWFGNFNNYTFTSWLHDTQDYPLIDKTMRIMVRLNLVNQRPWHILPSSPWPFFTAMIASGVLVSVVCGLHSGYWADLPYCLIFLICCMYSWANDVSHESRVENHHTPEVKRGLKLGFAGFIVSEVMFFLGFFIAQVNLSIEPHVFIWSEWPPYGIQPVSPMGLALVTTAVLLSSGLTMTWCQAAFAARRGRDAMWALGFTIALSLVFLVIQSLEYNVFATFNINDSVYGSCFYMITGLHGFHVIVGTLILIRMFRRLRMQEFRKVTESIGLTTGAWYWHFVDVVWLFVMTLLYITNSPW